MLTTRLTDLLECEHPVMLAGMGGVAYADLVVASHAGAAPMPCDRMKPEIAELSLRPRATLSVMSLGRRIRSGGRSCSKFVLRDLLESRPW